MRDSSTTSAGPLGSQPAPPPLAHAHGPILAGRGHAARHESSPGGALRASPGVADGRWLPRLRRAIDEDMFVLHFQPVVSLTEGRLGHHEALLRLADQPDGGLVAPAAFLPAAERNGLIGEIDRMVIDKAAALLAGTRGTRLAVNVSALSATDETMLAYIDRRLARHRVDPAALVIEVTETAAITDMARAREFCAGVESLGCAIALDDFGAGFGSFQYLKHLPFSQLKIDGDFIRALPASRTDQLVVKALVSVVRGMGRQTVAEFVGDEHTLTMLRSYGVDYAQGFHVGRPRAALPGR
jgi:EAL domain-containing protein (putative c-di-GMP-specific phosphodiesterase class I)